MSNCASAATMLAFGANEIQMETLAFLIAIDSSLRHDLSPVSTTNSLVSVSMDELNRVVKLWKKDSGNSEKIHTRFFMVMPILWCSE